MLGEAGGGGEVRNAMERLLKMGLICWRMWSYILLKEYIRMWCKYMELYCKEIRRSLRVKHEILD